MKQICKISLTGSVRDAAKGIVDPKALILMVANADAFEACVEELEEIFPGVPSVGCIAKGYDTSMNEQGITLVAYSDGIEAFAGVMQEVSKVPVKYIKEMENGIKSINPGSDNTVCIDFCSGNDACVLTTMHALLKKYNIDLMGGTGEEGKLSCNGVIYYDADVYLIIKNCYGRAKTYKENIYRPESQYRFIASDTDKSKYYVGKLNGESARKVYAETLGIADSDIQTQTFKNPLGKMVGKDICIISLKDVDGEGLQCYRQVNDSDVLTLLSIQDYDMVARETINKINSDFSKISAVFSVNCAFRYLYFTQNGFMDDYLKLMGTLNSHCGYVGNGEHCDNQFVNQSMSCVVFE